MATRQKTIAKNHASDSRIRYLNCQAEPGMFKGELLVFFNGFNPARRGDQIGAQLLVDELEVEKLSSTPQRNKPSNGWLRVTLLGEESGLAEIFLPQPAQPLGERILVESNQLQEKPGG